MKQIAKLLQIILVLILSAYSGIGQSNTYLVPVNLPAGYEQFNSNRGIRSVVGTPVYSDDRSVVKFANTISNGESLYFDITIIGNFYFIGLSGSPSETNIYSSPVGNPNMIFGMIVGLNSIAQAYENGNYTGPTTPLTSGNTLKISYSGSTILYQKSTDGINFTTFHTSNNVANGVYTVYFEAPPQGAGPDNLYKNGTAIIPAYAYVYKLKADSVKVTNDNCNAELIIENSTKNIQGFLYNYGNGRTQFRKISQKINDSIYLIGNDTLKISGGSNAAINGLSDSAGFTKLGGTLIENTIINGNGFRTHFTDTISTNKEFIIFHPTFSPQRQFSIGMGPGIDTTSLYMGWNMPKNLTGNGLTGRNFIMGNGAGNSLTTARYNMGIGLSVLQKNQTASFQTAIGNFSLQNIVSGVDNFALGDGVFGLADSGSYNYGSGSQVGQRFRYGTENTAVGNYAFGKSPGGSGNTVLGAWALYGIHGNTDTSNRNTIIGSRAMHLNNGGDDNIALGYRAGYNYNGNGKLFIHNDSMYNPLIGGDFTTRRLGINQNTANINYTIDAIIPAGENNYFSLKRMNDSIKLAHIIQGKTTFSNDSIFLAGQTRISSLSGTGDRMVVAGPNGDLTTQTIAGGGGSAWSLNGNPGTNSANNFIGTTDNQRLVFRTKNLEQATIDTLGNLGVGVTNPQYNLDVNGTAKINSMPFLANRDTVLTFDPVTKQIKVTKISSSAPTSNSVYILSPQSSTVTSTFPADGLSFSVTPGFYYKFRFTIIYSTAATTTGIKLGLTIPANTVFSAKADIPNGADGVNGIHSGWITSSNDIVTSTAVQTANTNYIATIDGIIAPTSSGIVQLVFGSEVGASMVTLKAGSIINIEPYSNN